MSEKFENDVTREIDRLRRENVDLLRGCRLAIKYLDHPDVREIPFAINSGDVAQIIRAIIDKAGKEVKNDDD